MRIVLKEMKKMINLKSMLFLMVFIGLFFYLEKIPQSFEGIHYIHYVDSNTYEPDYSTKYAIDLYRELISKAGPSLSPDEVKLLDDIEDEQYIILDSALVQYEELKEDGITTFKEFEYIMEGDHGDDEYYAELHHKYWRIFDRIKYSNDNLTYVKALSWLEIIGIIREELYFNWSEEELEERLTNHYTPWPDWYYEWKKELYSRDEYSLLYRSVKDTSFNNLLTVSVGVSICCMLIVLPYQVKEKLSRVKSLGAASKIGRSLYFRQWLAVICTCVLVALVHLLLYAVFFIKAGYMDFLSCSNAIAGNALYWIEMSFGMHLFVHILLIIIFTIAMGTVFFLLSEVSSYTEALAMGIPCWILFYVINAYVFEDLFVALGSDERPDIKFFEVWLLGILAMFAISVLVFFVRRNKIMDINE